MINKLRVGILEGDDIGHEIVPVAVEVAKAAAKLHQVNIEGYLYQLDVALLIPMVILFHQKL